MTAITGASPRLTSDFTKMAYDDLPTPEELRDDCRAAGAALAHVAAPRAHHRAAPTLRLEDLDGGARRGPGDDSLVAAAHRVADALALEQL